MAATLPSGFSERTLIDGLSSPVGTATAPDGSIFVVEKPGVVKVMEPGGPVQTLLDISDHVNSHHDRGLLGVGVDRDFAQNGYLYLLYTYDVAPLTADSSSPTVGRLSRVTVTANNTASAETVLLGSYGSNPCPPASNALDCIPSDGASHSIGTIRIDPGDGTLWVGVGDSASFNAVDNLAFRSYGEQSLSGKILHIDRDGRGLSSHPFCPADTDLTHVCTKVHAKGFRNPFRFSIRPDGPPIVGDVGWAATEELDIVQAGQNMGWPCWEGGSRTPGYQSDPESSQLTNDWDFGDGSARSSEPNPLHDYPTAGDYTARLTVSDGEKTDSTTVKISAGNTPPVVSLASPTGDLTYKAGDEIQLSGSAVDAEDGALRGTSLEWRVILRHGTHAHPSTTRTGQTASFSAADNHDSDSKSEITLVATDSRGLRAEQKVVIEPRTVQYNLNSDPVGVGVPTAAPPAPRR